MEICQSTRPEAKYFANEYRGAIYAGVSPRASLWLSKLSKYMAFIDNKDFVSPDHLLKVIPSVMGHRMILTYEAKMDRMDPGEMALRIAQRLV